MSVPFVDLPAMHRPLDAAIRAAISTVIEEGAFILGPSVGEFERAFAEYCGTKQAVGVASGLDALSLVLEAAGIGEGDEVITAANTFVATVCAIRRIGAQPVLVDCDLATSCLAVDRLEEAMGPRTRAVVPVHLYGRVAAMDELLEITERRGVMVLEDAAQAHGAVWRGRRAGSFGRAAGFSFYPAKNLGCFGDGGAVTTSDTELADCIRLLGNYGQREKNVHILAGGNSRLDTLHAAVLRVKLDHLDEWNRGRQRVARAYADRLRDLPIELPEIPESIAEHVFHLYVVHLDDRDRVRAHLGARGIATGLHYPTPVHLQPAFSDLGHGEKSFPAAERSARRLLTLPMFPTMTEAQVDEVASALESAWA